MLYHKNFGDEIEDFSSFASLPFREKGYVSTFNSKSCTTQISGPILGISVTYCTTQISGPIFEISVTCCTTQISGSRLKISVIATFCTTQISGPILEISVAVRVVRQRPLRGLVPGRKLPPSLADYPGCPECFHFFDFDWIPHLDPSR